MNLSTVSSRLLRLLKVRSKRYEEEVRTEHINQAIRDLDDEFDSSYSQETTDWDTAASTGSYDIATMFASPAYEFAAPIDVYYISDDGEEVSVNQLAYEKLRRAYPEGSDGGAPLYFAIFERKIHLRPVPDAVYTLYWDYTGRRRALADPTDSNEWTENEPWAVIYGAARYGVIWILEEERLRTMEAAFQRSISNVSIRETRHLNARRPVSQEPG
jgi:hypothetical protein